MKPDFFKPWIKSRKGAIWIALFLVLLSALVQFGLFSMNQHYVVGYFGAQPEDVSLSILLSYVGVLAILPVQFRFLQYFERRSYFIFIIVAGILLSIANLYTTDIFTFMILRVFTGFEVAAIAGCTLTLFFASLPPAKAPIIGSSIFYATILSNVVVIGILTAWVTDNYNWKDIYKYLIVIQVSTLIIVLLLLNHSANVKRYPLYQIDWFSFTMALTAGISLSYTMIYGPKFYWFTDARIQLSAFIAFTSLAILFYRQSTLKRPYIHLAVFRVKEFILGMLLMLVYYGVKDSINLIFSYCGMVLKWDSYKIMWLASCNLSGFFIFMIIAIVMLASKKFSFRTLFILGFSVLAIYHIWMYYSFTPDVSFADLAGPVFLQGAASGFLFIPIVIYTVSKLPAYTGFTGITLAAMARFTATLNSIAGFYTLQLYFNKLNKETFLRHLTNANDNFTQRLSQFVQLFRSKGFSPDHANALATTNIGKAMAAQSQLITNMHIFKLMLIIVVVVLFVLILAPALGRIFRFMVHLVRKETPALQ